MVRTFCYLKSVISLIRLKCLKNEIKVAIAESIPSNINSIDDIFIKERLHVVESIVTAVEQMLE